MAVIEMQPFLGKVEPSDIRLESRVKVKGGKWSPWELDDGGAVDADGKPYDAIDAEVQRVLALRGPLSGMQPTVVTIEWPNGMKLQFRRAGMTSDLPVV